MSSLSEKLKDKTYTREEFYNELNSRLHAEYNRGRESMRDAVLAMIIGYQNVSSKPWGSEAMDTANEICKMITDRYGRVYEKIKE